MWVGWANDSKSLYEDWHTKLLQGIVLVGVGSVPGLYHTLCSCYFLMSLHVEGPSYCVSSTVTG